MFFWCFGLSLVFDRFHLKIFMAGAQLLEREAAHSVSPLSLFPWVGLPEASGLDYVV
jgi:hypothetical protein